MSLPHLVFAAFLAIGALFIVWNSYRLRRDLGDSPTLDEIRKRHPRAAVLTLTPKRQGFPLAHFKLTHTGSHVKFPENRILGNLLQPDPSGLRNLPQTRLFR